MRRSQILITMVLCGMCISRVQGQIPHTLNYQGVLTDANGAALPDGNVALTFRLFDVAAGGTALWQEVQQVAVNKGVFNAILGSTAPLNLPFDKQYWLGINVGQGTELTPRVMLTASPYSLNSHSTVTEPAPGQGLTIRDAQGNPTHVFEVGGGALHSAKTTIRMPPSPGGDTALVIYSSKGPALFAVRADSASTLPLAARVAAPKGEYIFNFAIGGYSATDVGVYGESESGLGVNGSSISGIGTGGVSKSGSGVTGNSESGRGVLGTSKLSVGVQGASEAGVGVYGQSVSERGVYGVSRSSGGVQGSSETGVGVTGFSVSGVGVFGKGTPAGLFEGEVRITTVNPDPGQERFLVWSNDEKVRYRNLPPTSAFDGILQGKALVVKNAVGVEVFRVDTNGTSLHKGDETFEGDVIMKGESGKGAKLVDAGGHTIAGFGRLDLDTDQRIGVYGKAEKPGDLAGAFEGDVEVVGEIYASSLHIVRGEGDTVVHFNADGTSEHKGLETYRAGLQTVLTNGNILRMNPAEGLTLKTGGGQFRGHMDPNGNGLFAGNVGVAGNLSVGGTLSKAGGSFKIDHPLDPANKYLYHSFVESPDMKNIYDGTAVLDEHGEASVALPAWFEALNKDFRYQLTAIGAPGPNLHIAKEISGNQFRIGGGEVGQKVSWQVTGIRKDAYAEKNRIPIEEAKPVAERGHYLYPEVFGVSPEMGVNKAFSLQADGGSR
jgi:hypothetical protein